MIIGGFPDPRHYEDDWTTWANRTLSVLEQQRSIAGGLPVPGDDWKSWAVSLVSSLEQQSAVFGGFADPRNYEDWKAWARTLILTLEQQ